MIVREHNKIPVMFEELNNGNTFLIPGEKDTIYIVLDKRYRMVLDMKSQIARSVRLGVIVPVELTLIEYRRK